MEFWKTNISCMDFLAQLKTMKKICLTRLAVALPKPLTAQ
jgi:hypothetical protein